MQQPRRYQHPSAKQDAYPFLPQPKFGHAGNRPERNKNAQNRIVTDCHGKLGIDFFAEGGIVPEFDLGLPRVGNRQP